MKGKYERGGADDRPRGSEINGTGSEPKELPVYFTVSGDRFVEGGLRGTESGSEGAGSEGSGAALGALDDDYYDGSESENFYGEDHSDYYSSGSGEYYGDSDSDGEYYDGEEAEDGYYDEAGGHRGGKDSEYYDDAADGEYYDGGEAGGKYYEGDAAGGDGSADGKADGAEASGGRKPRKKKRGKNKKAGADGEKKHGAWRVIKRILIAAAAIGGILLLAGTAFVIYCVSQAPSVDLLDVKPQYYRSSVLNSDGNVTLTLTGAESNRVYAKLAEIPQSLQDAVVAIEDERFYEHNGVDVRGVARALVTGLTSGSFSQGASTITQQLIKNNVLTGWTEEKNFFEKLVRKVQEQFLALSLETKVDKPWILENYLNTINLGGGNWGVETAARYYFDKDVSELTLSEATVLAGITKSPTNYNPRTNPENNAERRAIILQKMAELGYITEEERQAALADNVYERIAAVQSEGHTQEIMSYFEDEMIREIMQDMVDRLGYTEDEAWDILYRGGLTIYSTENDEMQGILEAQAARTDIYAENAQVSMVMVDTETGHVLAMIGGKGEKDGSLLFNRATDSTRQPGSTIKVIGEYANGIAMGNLTLGTTVDDAPYEYSTGDSISNSYDYYNGKMTVRDAIAVSSNIVALKCFQECGVDSVFEQLQSFGISTLTDEDKVEALAIGGTHGGVTNLEMTAAYGTIARGGTYKEPIYYTKILDHDGNVLLENTQEEHKVLSQANAELLTSALQSVVQSGTAQDTRIDGLDTAGKSGTTNGVRDSWFIGFSTKYTLGIWGGCDDNSQLEDGGYVRAIWRECMSEAHGSGTADFSTEGLVKVKICKKCGKKAVEGLCDSTLQGDMTAEEYFASGTQPLTSCTCHEEVEICKTSGMRAGKYCRSTETKVYLKEGTEGTADAGYVIPESLKNGGTCTTHKNFFNGWFNWGNGSAATATPTPTPSPSPSGNDEDDDGGWDFWDWIWGDGDSENEEGDAPENNAAGDGGNNGDAYGNDGGGGYEAYEAHEADDDAYDYDAYGGAGGGYGTAGGNAAAGNGRGGYAARA